jgi:hypothetical protein
MTTGFRMYTRQVQGLGMAADRRRPSYSAAPDVSEMSRDIARRYFLR